MPTDATNPKLPRLEYVLIGLLSLGLISVMGMELARNPRLEKREVDFSSPTITQVNVDEVTNLSYPIVDTGQEYCFDEVSVIACGVSHVGQDAEYLGNVLSYVDNGDGTITDVVTGLMWQQSPGNKMTYAQAKVGASRANTGGYNDWRLPTIKELYSLMDFSGMDPSGNSIGVPFIDDGVFDFEYGDERSGDRQIDSQWATSSEYLSTVMNNQRCFFGMNFADGRIKCYPSEGNKTYYALYVRGNNYGENSFINNNDGTIIDLATGLTWMRGDSGKGLEWGEALAYCESLELAGHADWRLPNAKELHSVVDYTRSPDSTNSPAMSPMFDVSNLVNEAGLQDNPFYWTSTTHRTYPDRGTHAVYVSFGRAMGYMSQFGGWVDVHGAGAQRSDPKTGNASDYPQGHGPQGDAIRINNFVRCVRGGESVYGRGVKNVDTFEQSRTQQNTPSTAINTTTSPPTNRQPDRQPPPEAELACSGKQLGSPCSFSTPRGEVTGSCRRPESELICVPSM